MQKSQVAKPKSRSDDDVPRQESPEAPPAKQNRPSPATAEVRAQKAGPPVGRSVDPDRLHFAPGVAPDREGPAAVEMQEPRVEDGEVVVIEDRDERQARSGERDGATVDALAEEQPARRLVLIGRRPGLTDCSRIRVIVEPQAYVIELPPAQGTIPDRPAGCMVHLPRDARRIRVDEQVAEER